MFTLRLHHPSRGMLFPLADATFRLIPWLPQSFSGLTSTPRVFLFSHCRETRLTWAPVSHKKSVCMPFTLPWTRHLAPTSSVNFLSRGVSDAKLDKEINGRFCSGGSSFSSPATAALSSVACCRFPGSCLSPEYVCNLVVDVSRFRISSNGYTSAGCTFYNFRICISRTALLLFWI